ncbi:hypothetical protein ACFPOA_07740 [Lysobacter niabensis]|uniref:hypothetical protein n=1 Tax=Agrilutibacter niabensis TaxID=380628 RepID=UPI0036066142
MVDRERRQHRTASGAELRAQLTEDQLLTLQELERFGCELKFIRRAPFQDPVAVVIDGDRKSFSVLKPDGTLDNDPQDLKLRDSLVPA